MDENKTNASSSFPLAPILFVVFLTLRLTGHIDWSWWWVTAPLWGPIAVIFALLPLAALFGFMSKIGSGSR